MSPQKASCGVRPSKSGWRAVPHVDRVVCRLTPKVVREPALCKHGPNLLEDGTVRPFGDVIVLGYFVGSELTTSTLPLEVFRELVAQEYSAVVRVETLDTDPLLSPVERFGLI